MSRQYLRETIHRVVGHPRIRLFTETELLETTGTVGQFTSVFSSSGGEGDLETRGRGGGHRRLGISAEGISLRRHPRILTQLELQERLFPDPEEIREGRVRWS